MNSSSDLMPIATEDSRPVAHRLPKLAPGPWISLGGLLNYEDWDERDRFLELDRLIAAKGHRDCKSVAA